NREVPTVQAAGSGLDGRYHLGLDCPRHDSTADHDGVPTTFFSECIAYLLRDAAYKGKINAAIRPAWRSHAYQRDVGVKDRSLNIGGGRQMTGPNAGRNQLGYAILDDRTAALLNLLYLGRGHVNAN